MLDLRSRVAVRFIDGDTTVRQEGRLIGRAVTSPPRYDVMFDDYTILPNIPAADVEFVAPPPADPAP